MTRPLIGHRGRLERLAQAPANWSRLPERQGCTTNSGLLEAASRELKFAGSDVVASFCNSRLMVCCPLAI